MPERRDQHRPDARDRRSLPRPPLWLNLLLLLLGIGGLLFAQQHRARVSTEFADVIAEEARTPADVRKMKDELAAMDLTRGALEVELKGRMQFVQSLKTEDFYLSIDTTRRKFRLHYGDTILREGDVTPGEARTISGHGHTWTFVPVKGAFPVEAKIVDYAWQVPEWVYAMNQQPVPASRPVIPGGLGKYVLVISNNYVIHSPPSVESPLKGAKPGSFMVSEDDLRAIWPRLSRGKTQVYIY